MRRKKTKKEEKKDGRAGHQQAQATSRNQRNKPKTIAIEKSRGRRTAELVVAVGKVAQQRQEEVEREKAMLTEDVLQLKKTNQRLLDCNGPPEHNAEIASKEERREQLEQDTDKTE